MNTSLRNYVAVFRAPAAIRFEEESCLKINLRRPNAGPITVTFQTRYDESGLETRIPRELWIDARGTANGLNDAINEFGMAVSELVPLLAVTENAAILELRTHLAFDNTEGATEREFFQSFLPDERGLPRMSIRAKPKLTVALLECMFKANPRDRILRACAQYHQALMYWAPGQELLALAHLYMGIEAITKTVLRQECARRGVDEEGLAAALGIEKKHLDSTIRSDFIFAGDQECYKEAKKASDGFEHGFLAFDELQALATKRRNTAATYLRNAIFKALNPADETLEKLLKRGTAVGAWRLVRNFRGRLLGEGNELAAPENEYPIIEWHSSIKSATKAATGEISFTPDERLTVQIAAGISLKPDSYEVWGPETGAKREPIRKTVVPNITPPPDRKRKNMVTFVDSLNRDVLAYGGSEPIATNYAGLHALSIFAECRSQFQATALLVKGGLPNEALLIAHCMARSVERLRLLVPADQRLPLIVGWIQDYFDSEKGVDGPTHAPGFDIQFRSTADELADRQKKLSELIAAQRLSVMKCPFPEPDPIRSSALTNGGYFVSKQIVSGFGGHFAYSKPNPEGVPALHNVCDDTEQIAFVAAFCSETILLACAAIGKILDWPTFPDFQLRVDGIRAGEFQIRTTQKSCSEVTVTDDLPLLEDGSD